MKKTLVTLALIMVSLATQVFAMSLSNVRNHARFMSDRMAYELDLTPAQYDDCYEINFDFIYTAERIMNDVVYGYGDAIETYYRLLDNRNEDLRYVLNARQFAKFMKLDYFYRPIYSTGRDWSFRVYTIYSNRKFFYYDAPTGYKVYKGGHSTKNYYQNRHNQEIHKGNTKIYGSNDYKTNSRNDFGTVRRERNNKQQNSINNYSNPNQPNRTQDQRYEDKSGNKNSPQINHRQDTPAKQQADKQSSKPDNKQQPAKQDNKQGSSRGGRR